MLPARLSEDVDPTNPTTMRLTAGQYVACRETKLGKVIVFHVTGFTSKDLKPMMLSPAEMASLSTSAGHVAQDKYGEAVLLVPIDTTKAHIQMPSLCGMDFRGFCHDDKNVALDMLGRACHVHRLLNTLGPSESLSPTRFNKQPTPAQSIREQMLCLAFSVLLFITGLHLYMKMI